ncbi:MULTISPECIES: lytic transglycosylase domain-containing protein [unclassified Spirillospora]|uniref:lytic transglycosylase domain-containing protein n=1 Tax=unclassified Spirillospora TaxID=2642701 RepID=UPI0037243BD9
MTIVIILLVLAVVAMMLIPGSPMFVQAACAPNSSDGGSGVAQADAKASPGEIPRNYARWYSAVGEQWNIPKNVLAGIGWVETRHGTARGADGELLPGVARGTENYAHAGGPMQFIPSSWIAYGADGDGDGKEDRWNPADAIAGAANHLRGSIGKNTKQDKLTALTPDEIKRAVHRYNPGNYTPDSNPYVKDVLAAANYYAKDFNVGSANYASTCSGGGKWPPGATCPGGKALGPENITARMRCVRNQIKAKFSIPRGIGCYRANGGIPGGGEHPLGRACDFMISSGSPTAQEAQLGRDIADWAKANAQPLGIEYIIYRQQIWSPARAREGWRAMENRGGVTANHYDHVHISVLAERVANV